MRYYKATDDEKELLIGSFENALDLLNEALAELKSIPRNVQIGDYPNFYGHVEGYLINYLENFIETDIPKYIEDVKNDDPYEDDEDY